jgi:hypothetical protein
VLICLPHEMVVVSTIREPGEAGLDEDEIVHELMPTVPGATVVDVVEEVVVEVVVVATGTIVVEVVVEVELLDEVVVTEVSIETLLASALNRGPAFPAASDMAFAARRAMTVPSEVQVTLTVMEVPELELGVKVQPLAVPLALLKSPDAIPLTDSLNASV